MAWRRQRIPTPEEMLAQMADPVRGVYWVMKARELTDAREMDGYVSGPGINPIPFNHIVVAEGAPLPVDGDQLPITIDRALPSAFVIHWEEV